MAKEIYLQIEKVWTVVVDIHYLCVHPLAHIFFSRPNSPQISKEKGGIRCGMGIFIRHWVMELILPRNVVDFKTIFYYKRLIVCSHLILLCSNEASHVFLLAGSLWIFVLIMVAPSFPWVCVRVHACIYLEYHHLQPVQTTIWMVHAVRKKEISSARRTWAEAHNLMQAQRTLQGYKYVRTSWNVFFAQGLQKSCL